MTGLIVLLILIPLIFLALLISILSRTTDHRESIDALSRKITQLTEQIELLAKGKSVPVDLPPAPPPVKVEFPKPGPPPIIETPKPVEPPPVERRFTPRERLVKKESQEEVAEPDDLFQQKIPSAPTRQFNWRKKNNTDIEKFIGENLANKIGIAVLVLGIGFFIKYAVDKDWINETGRVLIGFACGAILIGIAHRIRNSYRSFSSVLVGGGLTTFYFSVAFAFHQYHLIGQQFAFVAMIVITGFAVFLAVFYDRQELAILAAIGGFATPFLLSTGQNNYVALFTYLCILNTGMMVLSWFKRWPAINIIALVFTTIIFDGWLVRSLWESEASQGSVYKTAFGFATVFYVLFIVMSFLNNTRIGRKFAALDFMLVLTTNFLYFGAGMLCLDSWSGNTYQGLFTGLLGLFNLALAAFFYKRKTIDPNFVSLLIALSLTFLSLVAPVQFSGSHIILFWAAEAVVLIWLYQQTRINHLKIASTGLLALTLLFLVGNWSALYLNASTAMPVIANKGFTTTLFVGIALLVYQALLRKEKPGEGFFGSFLVKEMRMVILYLGMIVVYLSGDFEIVHQFGLRMPGTQLERFYLPLYTFLFTWTVLLLFRKSKVYSRLTFILTLICFAIYYFAIVAGSPNTSEILLQKGLIGHSLAHWIGAALIFGLLIKLAMHFYQIKEENWIAYKNNLTWGSVIAMVILLSAEAYQAILWLTYDNAENFQWWKNLYSKAGLSILWGICSFVMMYLGMSLRYRTLRIISLTLFTITLVKLFLYDIRNIPPGGKIAAFILLGVLLLTVSFMYQRLKKLIIDKKEDERL